MMTMDAGFIRAVQRVLAHEGGYVNDPDDPGGETNFGISKRSYPNLHIEQLTREDAEGIYYRDFWVAPHINRITDERLAGKVFDLAVNLGARQAVKLLQRAANSLGAQLTTDGAIGPATLAAVNGNRNPKALLCSLLIEAGLFYRSLSKPKYLAGWLNRLMEV